MRSRYSSGTLASDLKVLGHANHNSPTKVLAKFLDAISSRESSEDKVWAAALSFAAEARQEFDILQEDGVNARLDTLVVNGALQIVYRHWNTKFCGHAKLAL